jgi:four helix bundle protein
MTYSKLIPPHGGYRKLKSYQTAEIIYDLTKEFCDRYLAGNKSNRSYRTYDQMFQAARSGKQNIAEGCQVSGTSKKSELHLISVARASLEELLCDYEDFLRQRNLRRWVKDSPQAGVVRQFAYRSDRSHRTYLSYLNEAESAANCLICLIHQANYLLDQQLKALGNSFKKDDFLPPFDRWIGHKMANEKAQDKNSYREILLKERLIMTSRGLMKKEEVEKLGLEEIDLP